MEKKCENEGCDKLMEKYNFDSPIEVTLVIEEEDPPDPILLTGPIVSNNTNVPNSNVYQNNTEVYQRTDVNKDNAKNKLMNVKNNSNTEPIEEHGNNTIPAFKAVSSEGHQSQTEAIQWQLLDSVADNLIHVTKCYYHNFINNKKQIVDNERLRFEYLTFKHYFFNLSYSTTISILLPKENDILFLNNFIHRVIEIANRSSWFQITYEMLDKLIRELLIWTKKKKTNLDIKFGSHNHEKGAMDSSSVISNRLNQSRLYLNRYSDKAHTTNHSTQGINSQPSRSHLPVQEMNSSPYFRHIANCSAPELTSLLNVTTRKKYVMEDTNNLNFSGNQNNSKPMRTNKILNNRSETFHSHPEKNVSPYFIPSINQGRFSPSNIDRRINNSTLTSLPYIETRTNDLIRDIEPKTNSFNGCEALNIKTSKILLSSGPPNQKVTISIYSDILANINYRNTNQVNKNATECHVNEAYGTVKRQKNYDSSDYPYSYSNSLPHHNDHNFNNNQNNRFVTNSKLPVDDLYYDSSRRAGCDMFNTDTLRSSISRDSGCESPTNGNFRYEPTIETPTNKEQGTPIISHVTSMNPNAVRLNDGYCKVCGATTNSMCIGCYQEYYCSLLCQTKHWEKHKYMCSG